MRSPLLLRDHWFNSDLLLSLVWFDPDSILHRGERLGKTNLVAKQCSAREGTLHLEVPVRCTRLWQTDGVQVAGDRVKLKGVATLVIEGSLVVPDKWLSRKRKLSTKL